MAEFLSTRGISLKMEEIIKTAEKELIIITPYLKFSIPIFDRLRMVPKHVRFDFIYGKKELNAMENTLLNELNCNIYYKEHLHAKCFLNESLALISSMNFYSFSEINNYEMGILLNYRKDPKAFNDCQAEVSLIKSNAKEIRQLPTEKPSPQKQDGYPREEFIIEWHKTLLKLFSQEKITYIEREVYIEDFLFKGVNFDTKYGIGTFNLKFPEYKCRRLRDIIEPKAFDLFPDYRIFWKSPSKIFLYWGKDNSFHSVGEEIEYCKKGVFDFVNFLKRNLMV